MARAVVITSYLEHPVDLASLLKPDDFIVCLDGGYDIALAQGIRPRLLLGDFDSIRAQVPAPADQNPADPETDFEIRRFPCEKDYTDLELALRLLDPSEFSQVLIVGALGGRLDMTLTNVQLLQRYTENPAEPASSEAAEDIASSGDPDYGTFHTFRRIEMIDGHNRCFVVHGAPLAAAGSNGSGEAILIPSAPDSFLSLIPLTAECRGVSLSGVKYPLQDGVLHAGETLSISNEFRAPAAQLHLQSGSLLVVVARGNERDLR